MPELQYSTMGDIRVIKKQNSKILQNTWSSFFREYITPILSRMKELSHVSEFVCKSSLFLLGQLERLRRAQ